MSDDACRWHLIDLGAYRPAHYCATHHAWKHRFACFDEQGYVVCVCGLSQARTRPAAPTVREQVA